MDNNDYQTAFSKALLTGLFTGVAATLICLLFAVIYRSITGFYLFAIINFPAIIFGCILILSVIGIIYFMFRKFLKHGDFIFILVLVLFTLFCIWKAQGIQRSDVYLLNIQFRKFFSGVIIILCVSALMIPVLYKNKKFVNTFI